VPYGGACLPKDTTAFMAFVREHGGEHLLLDATIEVNRRLAARVAAASPDQIGAVLEAGRVRDQAMVEEELVLEVVAPMPAVVYR